MKRAKFLSVFLIVIISIMLLVFTASAETVSEETTTTEPTTEETNPTSGQCGGNITWTFDAETGTLALEGTGPMYDYTYKAPAWWVYWNEITNITLSEGITSIGELTLGGCDNVTSITIPETVTDIGYHAFYEATGLKSIVIPDAVTSIGEGAFYGCTNLESITLGKGIKVVSSRAFEGCDNLSRTDYTGDVASWCSIDFLGAGANPAAYARTLYINGELLTDLVIPESITKINGFTFGGLDCLKSITLHSGVTSIGAYAFNGCGGLTEINLNEGLTDIGSAAFSVCSSLEEVTIPSSIEVLKSKVFTNCTRLKKVTFSDNLKEIGSSAFSRCESLESVVIPDSVETVGGTAFYRCGLLNVKIGKGVKDMDVSSFMCLTDIYYDVDEDNEYYSSADGVLFNKDKTVLIRYPSGNERTSYTIPEGVTEIGERAFLYSENLYEIIIPDGVEIIGNNAFSYCRLRVVRLSKTVKTIEKNAFTDIRDFNPIYAVYYSGIPEDWALMTIGEYNDHLVNAKRYYDGCDHIYESTVTKEPTCKAKGILTKVCSVCGEERQEELDIVDHKCSEEKIYDPTCYSSGYYYYPCEWCSYYRKGESIPPLGHIGGTATCSFRARCTRCYSSYGVLDENNHTNIVKDEAVEPTCTSTGLTEGSHCEGCGFIITAQETIAMTAHEYDSSVIAPTCTAEGYTVHICKQCKQQYNDNLTAATGHTGGTATCCTFAVCTECGLTYGSIDENNHANIVVTEAVDPTCTTWGFTESVRCEGCYKTLKVREAIPIIPHNYKAYNTVKPDCVNYGYTTYICYGCGTSYTDDIVDATGHNFVDGECTVCHEEEPSSESSFIDKIKEFFNKILEFFRNLFGM